MNLIYQIKKTWALPSFCRVSTTIWLYHLCSNETLPFSSVDRIKCHKISTTEVLPWFIFARTPMIRRIVRTWKDVDRFLRKSFGFLTKNLSISSWILLTVILFGCITWTLTKRWQRKAWWELHNYNMRYFLTLKSYGKYHALFFYLGKCNFPFITK